MLKKTAQALLVSIVAMNASFAMQNDKIDKKGGFRIKCKALRNEFFKRDVKKNQNQKIEIIKLKVDRTDCTLVLNTYAKVKDKLPRDHFFIKAAIEKQFGLHHFPKEIRKIIALLSYQIADRDVIYPFPHINITENLAASILRDHYIYSPMLPTKEGIKIKYTGFHRHWLEVNEQARRAFLLSTAEDLYSEKFEIRRLSFFYPGPQDGQFVSHVLTIDGFYDLLSRPVDLSQSSVILIKSEKLKCIIGCEAMDACIDPSHFDPGHLSFKIFKNETLKK